MSSLNKNIVKPLTEVQALYNTKIKYYPNFTKTITFSKPIYNPHKYEVKRKIKREENNTVVKRESRSDNIKRAKDKALDICFSNEFEYFITLTLDPAKINRYDKAEVYKKLKVWLSNKVTRNNLKYIIFPEYHADGAIHFHGLCSGDLKLVDSGRKTVRGQVIYNAGAWTYGFSTVIQLEGEYERIVNYVAKYITKENKKVFGKYYLSGGKNLKREVPSEYLNTNFMKAEGKTYHVPNTDIAVKYHVNYDNDMEKVSRETKNSKKEV